MKVLKKPVVMDPSGRLTMPAEARQELHLEGETQFIVEYGAEGIVLRPAVTIPREDAWAYKPEHMKRLERALEDVRAGRSISGGEVQLNTDR